MVPVPVAEYLAMVPLLLLIISAAGGLIQLPIQHYDHQGGALLAEVLMQAGPIQDLVAVALQVSNLPDIAEVPIPPLVEVVVSEAAVGP